jgi:phage/plasmid-like protein (TIGR03299 family)
MTTDVLNKPPISTVDFGIGHHTQDNPLVDLQLNWQVKKLPLQYMVHGVPQKISQCALVRKDNYKLLSVVPSKWKPIQNREFVQIVKELLGGENLQIDLGGSFNDGEYVWLLVKGLSSFTLRGEDVVQSYFLFTNPHVYGSSFSIQLMPIRESTSTSICFSLKPKNHTQEIGRYNFYRDLTPDTIKKIREVGAVRMKEYEKSARLLTSKKYTEEEIQKFLKHIVPTTGNYPQMSRPSIEIAKVLDNPPEGNLNNGTWWQALNAVLYYFDHMAGNTTDTRMFSNWYAKNRKIKLDALNAALRFASKDG